MEQEGYEGTDPVKEGSKEMPTSRVQFKLLG